MHADGEDMIFVEISAEDRDGYPVENASDYVRVTVEGAGRLVGLDNGDSADYDAYKGTVRKLFQGKLLAMIAAKTTPGEIRVTVKDAWAATVNSMTNETGTGTAKAAAGHRTATVTLQAVEAPIRPGVCATEEKQRISARLCGSRICSGAETGNERSLYEIDTGEAVCIATYPYLSHGSHRP